MKYIQIIFDYKIGSVLRRIEGLTEKAMNEMVAHKLKTAMVEQLSEMDIDRFINYCTVNDTDIPVAMVMPSDSNFCYFEIPVE